jgi:thiosulfate dehydrogenase [quinone] large subunit
MALPPTPTEEDARRGRDEVSEPKAGEMNMKLNRAASTSMDRPLWPKDALRISFGVIWLVDATLKWLPGFRANYMDAIMGTSQGQPGWIRPWFDFWISLQHPDAGFFAYFVAAVETLIALALIFGFVRKMTYIAAAVFSFLIWSTAEAFGGPYTSGAADIGTGIIYTVVFLALLALSYYAGPARFSADYYLEKRITWWWRVAEVRRPGARDAELAEIAEELNVNFERAPSLAGKSENGVTVSKPMASAEQRRSGKGLRCRT